MSVWQVLRQHLQSYQQRRQERALNKSLRGVTSARGVNAISLGANPLLTSRTPVWRSLLVVAALALGFTALIGRAAYIQIIHNDFYQTKGEVRFARTLTTSPTRGRILDRHGLILASSVPAQSIWALPADIDWHADSNKLADMAVLLGMRPKDLKERIVSNSTKNFVYIKRQIDDAVAQKVMALGIKGIHQRQEYRRQYPEGASVSHIVGFTGADDKGQEGIERTFDAALTGSAGSRRVIRDRLGRVVEGVGEQITATDGADIRLTIDSKVQYFAWQKLREAVIAQGAKGGSVVVLDVKTGEVLALANYPSYDPNIRGNLTGEQLRNRALTDPYEPGSIIKPLTVALALQQKKVSPQTSINTSPGVLSVYGFTIKDTHNYGSLSVEGVLQKSSNIGTVRIANALSRQDMWENFSNVGLGQKPNLPFPGITRGRIHPYASWRPIEKISMSYGYGLSASLFQITRAYSVFGNDGVLMPVTLVCDSLTDPNDHRCQQTPGVGERVYSSTTARQILRMLHKVTLPGGTAQQAQTVGYSVGGKTGTVRKQEGKVYSTTRYRGSFVGVAPIEAPRIAVGVMIDEPKTSIYGGATAAPVFSTVVQQTLRILGVPPDISIQPAIIATDAPQEPMQ